MRRNTTAALIALVASASLLTGCSSTLAASDIEDQIISEYDADAAECPEDLEAEEGATMMCDVTVGQETFQADVVITQIDGETAEFDITSVE